jgi:hypothetical protein
MKILIFLFSIFVVGQANAQSSNVVFDCRAEIEIDPTDIQKLGMTVEQQGADYVSYLVGTSEAGALETKKQVATYADGLLVAGVREILAETSLSAANRTKISSVVIYTQGNFEDDAAGVRGVAFLDAQDGVLATGMFFGWAGPYACR